MTQPLLLDTCAAIYITDGEWMQPEAVEAIDTASDRGQTVLLSPITAWEVGQLASRGRLRSSYSPQKWIERLLSFREIAFCALTPDILLQSSFLPGRLNKDPADRIIAATAREHGFTVMTRDRNLLDYGHQGYLSVVAC